MAESPHVEESTKATSHNLAFTLMQNRISFQMGQVDTLDAKANSTQVSATALISAALILEAALFSLKSGTFFSHMMQAIALLPLLITYVCSIYFSSKGYRIREWDLVPKPETLYSNLSKPEDDIKTEMLDPLKAAYENNEVKIKDKTLNIDRSILALRIQALLLVLVLLIQTILLLSF